MTAPSLHAHAAFLSTGVGGGEGGLPLPPLLPLSIVAAGAPRSPCRRPVGRSVAAKCAGAWGVLGL